MFLIFLRDFPCMLKVHIGTALNVGLTREEIIEAIAHTAVYAGIPRLLRRAG
jgi:alkylhydroperoxidase/carboxymuconolactone decarboxylase family protein YurZ